MGRFFAVSPDFIIFAISVTRDTEKPEVACGRAQLAAIC